MTSGKLTLVTDFWPLRCRLCDGEDGDDNGHGEAHDGKMNVKKEGNEKEHKNRYLEQ